MHRYSYADFHRRVHCARARRSHAWRPAGRPRRHALLEQLSPSGAVLRHPLLWRRAAHLNLRLASDQLAYIINHAEDQVIFVDASLAAICSIPSAIRFPACKHFVILPDQETARPADYEQLLESAPAEPYPWPRLDENTAAATCYTSGTTGNPKGVLYTHRSLFLHSFALAHGRRLRDLRARHGPADRAHVSRQRLGHSVCRGDDRRAHRSHRPRSSARRYRRLIQNERVTFTAGVPTIWMGLYGYLENSSARSFLAPHGGGRPAPPCRASSSNGTKRSMASISGWPGA